ncbi:MAG: hypothetical protein KF758_18805 [Anaerolineales bacterium]|nr:hypothetical protein [Anaerolineales bacterium]
MLTTNVGSTTTSYFVGNYYQVENGVVTKCCYAGSQRISMRKNGTLNFILGDHLGSTSLVTDSTGVVINETKYKACPLRLRYGMLREGEIRYSSGTEQTRQTRYT